MAEQTATSIKEMAATSPGSSWIGGHCGRNSLTIDKSTIETRFGGKFYIAQASYDWEPTYNAAPSTARSARR